MTTGDLDFRFRYWEDPHSRAAFQRFLIEIHGLDLGEWERRGFWDHEDYLPFSLFDGDQVVASLCVYSMDLVIDSVRRRVGQLSGVGTAPERRRQGLGRWLTDRALEELGPSHEGFFLFANDEAVPYYRRCGFVPVTERAAILPVDPVKERPGARRLDMGRDRDLALLARLARERTPVSRVLGAHNPRLLMFHALYGLRERAVHVPDLGVVAFYGVSEGRLTLYDVVGSEIPSFAELHPYLATDPHREVAFRFVPDRMGIPVQEHEVLTDDQTHVLPGLDLPAGAFVFPHTGHA